MDNNVKGVTFVLNLFLGFLISFLFALLIGDNMGFIAGAIIFLSATLSTHFKQNKLD